MSHVENNLCVNDFRHTTYVSPASAHVHVTPLGVHHTHVTPVTARAYVKPLSTRTSYVTPATAHADVITTPVVPALGKEHTDYTVPV